MKFWDYNLTILLYLWYFDLSSSLVGFESLLGGFEFLIESIDLILNNLFEFRMFLSGEGVDGGFSDIDFVLIFLDFVLYIIEWLIKILINRWISYM